MDLLDLLLQPGDRVRVKVGPSQGRTGEVVEWRGDRIAVRSDATGKTVCFDPKDIAHIPTPSSGSPARSTADLDGLQNGSPARSTADLDGLQTAIAVLERQCTKLRSTALTDCWLKSWFRKNKDGKVLSEYHRLHFGAATGKKPEYVDAEDVPVLQERIANGRKLKALKAAIAILQSERES